MRRLLPPPTHKTELDVSLAIVNIVLLLIFFFLATGRLLNPVGPDLELSETSELPLDQLPSPILIVGTDGSWTLEGNPLTPELLGSAIQDLPDPLTLHILIDRTAPAGALLSIMSRPELAEAELRLVTLRSEGPGV